MNRRSVRWLVDLRTTPAQRAVRGVQSEPQWEPRSAIEIMERFESGDYDQEVSLRAGDQAQSKPLKVFIRELVWESRAEERSLSDEERVENPYLKIVNQAPVPTALSDLGGRITYVNQAFCDFLGYERAELVGMTVGQLSASDDHEQERLRGNKILAGQREGFHMEKRYLHKSGEERIGLLSISLIQDAQGVPTSVMAQIADLSQVKRMQTELLQAQSLAIAGRLAQEVTHDLKNILMTLKGTLDLLQFRADVLEPEELELIEGGLGVCDSGHELVRSLLDLQAKPRLAELDLIDWLKQQRTVLARFVAPYPLELEIINDPLTGFDPQRPTGESTNKASGTEHKDMLKILGDQRGLERALMNLCVNAKQALHRQPDPIRRAHGVRVCLRLATPAEALEVGADGVVVTVRDAGIGIAPDQLDHVSEPYFTTGAHQGGDGLGLAVVWSVCHHHNGTLHVMSELGVGSSFSLIIPRLVSPHHAEAPPPAPPDALQEKDKDRKN